MKLYKDFNLENFGVVDLSASEKEDVNGGGFLKDTVATVSWCAGYIVGCATNAADLLNTMLIDAAKGLTIDKALRKP
jgi:hypothetical protein